ncbi:MAG: ParB N-terminal domain-containing protein [Leptospiraceae bacterium]|nr:ParB N-terminal domain-containing protein [Leptospiraceae bacterium]
MKVISSKELKNVSEIFISPELEETQKYMPISKEDREALKESIRVNGIREPLKVYDKKGKYFLLAGLNRLEIARELEIKTVWVELWEGKKEEYRDFTIQDNLERRHFTNKQKIALVNYYLEKEPEKSDNAISKQTGTDSKTVTKVRKELISRGKIMNVQKFDSKGRKVGERSPNKDSLPTFGNSERDSLKKQIKEDKSLDDFTILIQPLNKIRNSLDKPDILGRLNRTLSEKFGLKIILLDSKKLNKNR